MNAWIVAPVLLPAVLGALLSLPQEDRPGLRTAIGLLGTAALLGIAVALWRLAGSGVPAVYPLGNWPAPYGIVLTLDRLSALMLVLTAGLALLAQGQAAVCGTEAKGRHFAALVQFLLMGLNGAFLTGDLFTLFVFFEVLLIASYGLAVHGGGAERLGAGMRYVAFNLVGSTLFLFALAVIYGVTGTLNMADLAVKVAALPQGEAALIRVGGVFLLLVFALKASLVPLHVWLPGTYARASGPVAALFAVMTKVGAYATIRVLTLIFPASVAATGTLFHALLLPAALLTLWAGSFGILGARSLPRMAAHATIASMGTIFVAIAAGTPQATAAALYYIGHSTLATALLFLVADLARSRTMPSATGALAALYFGAALVSAGMPPFSGFVGKLLILDAVRGPGMAWVWGSVLLTSFMAILGFARMGIAIFWEGTSRHPATDARPAPPLAAMAVPALFLGASMALSILAGPLTVRLDATAAALHDPRAAIAANALPAAGATLP